MKKKESYPGCSELEKICMEEKLNKSQRSQKRKLLSKQVKSVDLIEVRTIDDLVTSYMSMSIQARAIGQCASVYKNMLQDKARPTVLLGLAGPLIAGGLREVIRDMIAYGIVDTIVSTGAIFYQDIYQALGHKHYIGSPLANDVHLRELFINRIYDTYVDDEKFLKVDSWIEGFAHRLPQKSYSSREFLHLLGEEIKDENSILRTAAKLGVPVFSPALNDSSIGIGLTGHYHLRKKEGKPHIVLDAIRDNYELTQIILKSRKTAAIYVAGGVPKNFINDSVVMGYIFGKNTGGHSYAFQLTTDSPHWGGLSGSTFDEATSWGKISKQATKAMAFVEPTVSLPLVVGFVLQKKLWEKRQRLRFKWKEDILETLQRLPAK
ncbi:MAG: Deoxyhypusine synthase-like protein [Firmicutes bacterium]|nr:Deoxyhypusine synthase-like protein [Bacillota bacterium]